ncbi:MAG: hypothetical protein ACR9NN_03590 [Nostochopsis sp.]
MKLDAIAENICVSEGMMRYYWHKLQEALGIKNEGKNIRVLTRIRPRKAILID